MTMYLQQFGAAGFVVVPEVIDRVRCDSLARHVQDLDKSGAGSRTLLDQLWCVELARELRAHTALCAFLPANAVAVQCTLFDKTPKKNWLVALHQDLNIR
jgi:hypothetical protein